MKIKSKVGFWLADIDLRKPLLSNVMKRLLVANFGDFTARPEIFIDFVQRCNCCGVCGIKIFFGSFCFRETNLDQLINFVQLSSQNANKDHGLAALREFNRYVTAIEIHRHSY